MPLRKDHLKARAKQHKDVISMRGRASEHKCVDCGSQAEDWSHVHRTARRDWWNYQPRCGPCHVKYDLGKKTVKRKPRKCPAGCLCFRHL